MSNLQVHTAGLVLKKSTTTAMKFFSQFEEWTPFGGQLSNYLQRMKRESKKFVACCRACSPCTLPRIYRKKGGS